MMPQATEEGVQRLAKKWLLSNQLKREDVKQIIVPVGFVVNLIDRLGLAYHLQARPAHEEASGVPYNWKCLFGLSHHWSYQDARRICVDCHRVEGL